MEVYHKFDTQNSSTYNESLNTHLKLEEKQSNNLADISGVYNDNTFEIEDIMAARSMRCQKDTTLEFNLLTDQFNIPKYKTYCPSTPIASKEYSDCLGYQCNRNHPHDFMYQLDEYNTYHNYLVCDEPERKTCCPKNVQIFDNWTRRHHSTVQDPKPPTTLILEENKIPLVTMKQCNLTRTKL